MGVSLSLNVLHRSLPDCLLDVADTELDQICSFSNLQSIFFQTADPECLLKKPWLSNLCARDHHLRAPGYTCRLPPQPEIPIGEIGNLHG